MDCVQGVEKHIKNTYLKRLDVRSVLPKPAFKCWMELNEDEPDAR